MKRFAVFWVCVVFVGLLVAAPASAAHTVAEACGECEMPEGMEQYAAYEILVETYFVVQPVPGLTGFVRRIVTRDAVGSSTTTLIDQIVIEGHAGPGPIVMIITVGEGGSVDRLYQWRDQEIIELLSLLTYGKKGQWW